MSKMILATVDTGTLDEFNTPVSLQALALHMRIRRSQPTWTDDIHLHTSSRCFRCHHHHWAVVMPVVRRMLHHAASKLACIALSSAISCRSSICQGCLSTAWLVSLGVWSQRGDTRCALVVLEAVDVPFPGPFHLCLTLLIISTPLSKFVLSS